MSTCVICEDKLEAERKAGTRPAIVVQVVEPASHTGMLVWVPAALLPIQLLANVHSGRAQIVVQVCGSLLPIRKVQKEFWSPGFHLAQADPTNKPQDKCRIIAGRDHQRGHLEV